MIFINENRIRIHFEQGAENEDGFNFRPLLEVYTNESHHCFVANVGIFRIVHAFWINCHIASWLSM